MPNDELDMYELTLEEEDHIQDVDTNPATFFGPLTHTHTELSKKQSGSLRC